MRVEAAGDRRRRHHGGNAQAVEHRDDRRIPGHHQVRALRLDTLEIDVRALPHIGDATGIESLPDVVALPSFQRIGDADERIGDAERS